MLAQQLTELIGDEGIRLVVYDDGTGQPIGPGDTLVGHPTIGIGRSLDVHGISRAEATYLLNNDVTSVESALAGYTWFQKLDPVRQGVLVNLGFNLGLHGLMTFTSMLTHIQAGNYTQAASDLQNSRWATQVQKSRSTRLIQQLRTGQLAGGQPIPIPAPTPAPSQVSLDTISQGIAAILAKLIDIGAAQQKGFETMSGAQSQLDQEIAALQAAVAAETSVEQSALALIQGIPQMIANAVAQAQAQGATPAQLQAINDAIANIQASSSTLASAVTANTPPAAPAAPAAPATGAATVAGAGAGNDTTGGAGSGGATS